MAARGTSTQPRRNLSAKESRTRSGHGARPRAAPLAFTHCCHRGSRSGTARRGGLFAGDAEAQDSAGVTTYLEVITAQTAAPTNQINVMDVLTRRMTAGVLLIKALGGGWTMIARALSAMRLYSNSFQAVPIVVPIFTSAAGTPRTASRYAANAANAHDHSSPLGDRPSRDVRTSGAPPTGLFAWRWRCGSHRMSWTLRPTGRCCQAARGSPC